MVNHPPRDGKPSNEHPMDKPSMKMEDVQLKNLMFIGEDPWRNPWRSPWEGEKIRLDRTAPCCCSAPCRPGRTGNAAQNLNGKKLASIVEKNKFDDQSSSIIINHQSSIIHHHHHHHHQCGIPPSTNFQWRMAKTAETHGSPKFKAYCGVVCSISILVGYANITQSRDISINFMLKLSSCRGKTHICSGVQCKSLKKKKTRL